MQVENIECQIAQAQIGNFLAGSGLSDEAMRQLEEHIASCSHCKEALAIKRNELRAMLKPERAAVDFEAIHEEATQMQAKSIASALRKRSLQRLAEPEPVVEPVNSRVETQPAPMEFAAVEVETPSVKQAKASSSNYWKPLAYSLGLAGVLIGMSLFSNNLASIFGPRADQVAALTPPATTVSKPDEVDVKEPVKETTVPTDVTASQKDPLPPTTSNSVVESQTPASEALPNAKETGSEIGVAAGSLATTQFASPQTPAKIAPKPSAPVKVAAPTTRPAATRGSVRKPVRRRIQPRRIVRRQQAAKPARSRGIKVYQP